MSLSTLHPNARKSLNAYYRRLVLGETNAENVLVYPGLKTTLSLPDLAWQPNDWEERTYPSVGIQYLYHGVPSARRKRKLESRVQLSALTAAKQLKQADLILGALLEAQGFSLENQYLTVEVPLFDYAGAGPPYEPLLAMELEWAGGPEPGPVSESEEIHHLMDFRLYFS